MSKIPAQVSKHLTATVPKFKRVLKKAKEKDINEADTVTVVTDILAQVFGFDKYSEITKEYSIRGTYCDIAVKVDEKIEYLIEVKAIGLDLSDKHLRQVVNYASREGIKWVVLTNGINWEVYRVDLDGKVSSKRLFAFDFTDINLRKKEQQELLFLLCKRGMQKDLIDDFYEYRQSVNRHTIGALLSLDSVSRLLRKELRRLKPGIKVDANEIKRLIQDEVIKREILESKSGIKAKKQVSKYLRKIKKKASKSNTED